MHHKRKGPKSTRAGCLLCKPHKRQGTDEQCRQEQRARIDEREAGDEIVDRILAGAPPSGQSPPLTGEDVLLLLDDE